MMPMPRNLIHEVKKLARDLPSRQLLATGKFAHRSKQPKIILVRVESLTIKSFSLVNGKER